MRRYLVLIDPKDNETLGELISYFLKALCRGLSLRLKDLGMYLEAVANMIRLRS